MNKLSCFISIVINISPEFFNLSQNYSILKTLISKLWMSLIGVHTKIPYLETTGMPTRILLRKRRFKCYQCSKIAVAETPLVKKNHQIPRIINQKIAHKLIEKTSMTDIAHQLSISTSTVIRKLNDFHFKHDFSRLPEIMSWDVETVRGVTVSIGRWRWVSLHKILKSSISSLFLKAGHKLSPEITFSDTIEPFVVRWKSLLGICLVPIMT